MATVSLSPERLQIHQPTRFVVGSETTPVQAEIKPHTLHDGTLFSAPQIERNPIQPIDPSIIQKERTLAQTEESPVLPVGFTQESLAELVTGVRDASTQMYKMTLARQTVRRIKTSHPELSLNQVQRSVHDAFRLAAR